MLGRSLPSTILTIIIVSILFGFISYKLGNPEWILPFSLLVIFGFLFYGFKRRPLLSETEPETDATDPSKEISEKDDGWEIPTLHGAKANIAPLPEGGGIVYASLFQPEGYRLTKEQFEDYQAWMEKGASRKSWNRSVILALIGVGLAFFTAHSIGLPSFWITVGAIFLIVCIFAYQWYWPRHRFLKRFPDAPQARDPNRGKRRLLTYMTNPVLSFAFCNFSVAFCVFVLLLILPYEWESLVNGTVGTDDIANRIFVPLVLIVMAIFYGYLTIQHIRFRRRHGRAPTKADLDDPEILNAL